MDLSRSRSRARTRAALRSLILLSIVALGRAPAPAQDATPPPGSAPGRSDDHDHDHDHTGPADHSDPGSTMPRLSLVGDFVFSYGEQKARRAGADGFIVRSVEIGVSGDVDRSVRYFGNVFFDEEEVELEEAYADWLHGLPEGWSVRGGRFNLDFGRQNRPHDHDLPTLDKPSTLQEYIGGTVRGTGAQVGGRAAVGDRWNLRWSAAVLQDAESDAHAVLGPEAGHEHDEEDDDEDGPIRDVEDFAVNVRALSRVDLGSASALEFGASYLHAPSRVHGVDESDERSIDRGILGLDVTYDVTRGDGSGLRLQGEWLLSAADFGDLDENGTPTDPSDDTFTVRDETADGFYALAEFRTAHDWSFGASGSVYEHAEDPSEESADIGVFATWDPNHVNRVRFEVRWFDDLAVEEDGVEDALDFVAFTVQWTVVLGHHAHRGEW